MAANGTLALATELAAKSGVRYPNESEVYRRARTALLAEEIELRRHVERVAALRRQLPPGGEVPEDYRFVGESGSVTLAKLFGDKQTLVVYSAMYGPQRARPCPMCTSLLEAWDGTARNASQLISLVIVARSPVERLTEFRKERGWEHLECYSDMTGAYTRAYVNAEDADMPGLNVFTKRDGAIRHFWGSEMNGPTADPGQDPRSAPEIDPLWTLLDLTPEGRNANWYPKLEYAAETLVNIGSPVLSAR